MSKIRRPTTATLMQSIDRAVRSGNVDACLSELPAFATCTELAARNAGRPIIPTGVEALDVLLGGGLELGSVTEIFGEPRSGKTQLCHSLAVVAQRSLADPRRAEGSVSKVLYIDSVGSFRHERVRQIAEHHGLPVQATMDGISYARCYTSEHLRELVNMAGNMVAERGSHFALIIFDSIVGAFRGEMADDEGLMLTASQENLLAALGELKWLGEAFGVAVVFTNGVSPYDDMDDPQELQPLGGRLLGHFSTTQVLLRLRCSGQREAQICKSSLAPESSCAFTIASGGLCGHAV